MLCDFCEEAFRENSEDDDELVNHLLFSQPRRTVTSSSPFYKASHHSLPKLKQSASDGCQLCILLWSAAPSKVHDIMDEILRNSHQAHWLPCYITADQAIFEARQSSRRLLIEYKYQMVSTEPKDYVQPFKRHFRLLSSEEPKLPAKQSGNASNTWSQESWDTLRAWLWECTSYHGSCSLKSSEIGERRFPTRLIEVFRTNTVRLRSVKGIKDFHSIQYLALSHCWGSGTQFKLTSNSEAVLYEGIEISTLPKTFQDAIRVTKLFLEEFKIRYLWIDSLCIIQDSITDWRHESAIMGEIYQNAFCTLAATAAEDGDGGLFIDRDPREASFCAIPVVPKSNEIKYFYCVDHEDWEKNVSKSPLYRRSWVLQERLLSRRIIHFATDKLYWECSSLEASEEFPSGFPDGLGESFKQLLPFSGLPKIEPAGSMGRGFYGVWDRIMRSYSAGELTRSTDRLVALSGIAHKLQRLVIPHDTYVSGLWKHDLPFELLWDVEESQTPKSYEGYIAPTWSWAARFRTIPCERENWASAARLVDIISIVVVPIDNDHMGQVRGGYIRLSGVLARGHLSRTYQPGSPSPGIALQVAERTMWGARCRPDDGFSSIVPLPQVVYCLPILHSLPSYRGLLLVPSGIEGEFRRYGTFTLETYQNEFLTSCSPSMFETGPLASDGRYEFNIL